MNFFRRVQCPIDMFNYHIRNLFSFFSLYNRHLLHVSASGFINRALTKTMKLFLCQHVYPIHRMGFLSISLINSAPVRCQRTRSLWPVQHFSVLNSRKIIHPDEIDIANILKGHLAAIVSIHTWPCNLFPYSKDCHASSGIRFRKQPDQSWQYKIP